MRAGLDDLCGSRYQFIGEFAGTNHTMRIKAHVAVFSLLASTSVFAGHPRLDMITLTFSSIAFGPYFNTGLTSELVEAQDSQK